MRADHLPLLSAIKHMCDLVQSLDKKVTDMQEQIEAMQEEWRHEYEPPSSGEEESEEESEWESWGEEESDDSAQSAPASFSYKVQRTE
tara:strand:+ start:266 stop:529 length:264 start_codon:yes stop_codon:yes gene_type:complete